MDQITDSHELARRLNEDEAVWQRYEYRRRLRLRLGLESLPPGEILDELDWIKAERECREIWCVGKRFPNAARTTAISIQQTVNSKTVMSNG